MLAIAHRVATSEWRMFFGGEPASTSPEHTLARGLQRQSIALRLEHVVQAVLRKLDAGREPEIAGRLHVMNDAAQRQGATRPTNDVRVHREWDVFRSLRAALRIELVEIRLPGLEPVIRIAVFAVAVTEQRAVAERLSRQLDDDLAVLLVQERQLLVEAVGVVGEAVLDEELDGVGALRAGAPAVRPPARALLDHGDGPLHHRVFLIARQVARDLVIVAVAFHHMAVVENRLHRFREALRDRAAGEEGRLYVLFLQDPQQPVDRVVRAILALAPHFVIEKAILVRLDVLAALEIEGQKHAGPLALRPADEVVVMIFFQHAVPPDNGVARPGPIMVPGGLAAMANEASIPGTLLNRLLTGQYRSVMRFFRLD